MFGNLGETSHELKTGYTGSWGYQTATDSIGYTNKQQYRYRSTDAEEAAGQYFLNLDSVIVYNDPTFRKNGESYDGAFVSLQTV